MYSWSDKVLTKTGNNWDNDGYNKEGYEGIWDIRGWQTWLGLQYSIWWFWPTKIRVVCVESAMYIGLDTTITESSMYDGYIPNLVSCWSIILIFGLSCCTISWQHQVKQFLIISLCPKYDLKTKIELTQEWLSSTTSKSLISHLSADIVELSALLQLSVNECIGYQLLSYLPPD